MNCPKCGADSKVVETRGDRRRRQCLSCAERWSTIEIMLARGAVKTEKPKEPEKKKEPPVAKVSMAAQLKRNTEARRKLEERKDRKSYSSWDDDNDFLPDRW